MIVVDANVVVYFSIRSEHSALAEAAFAVDGAWAAPLLWRSEFRNTAVKYLRVGQMSVELALLSLQTAEEAIKEREYPVASRKVLELAKESSCSAYDCEYVALAQDLGVPLVTTDRQVLRAFPKTAVSLEQFARKKK